MGRGVLGKWLQASVLLLVGCCSLVAPRGAEAAVVPYWVVGGGTSISLLNFDLVGSNQANISIGNGNLSVDTDFGYPSFAGPIAKPAANWTVTFSGTSSQFNDTSSSYLVNSLLTLTDGSSNTYSFDTIDANFGLNNGEGNFFSNGQYAVQFGGSITVGATVVPAILILFVNDYLPTDPGSDSFGNAAWLLAPLGEAPNTVPEPSTLLVFGAGIVGLGWHSFRRRQASKK